MTHPVTRSALGLLVLVATTLGAAACATGRAQIPEPEPTLAVPPVPPRAIEPAPVPAPPVESPPVEPPPAAAPPPRTNRTRPPAESTKPDPKQPETPAETVGPVSGPPPVAPLRTPNTPTGPEAVRQIRDILDATQKLLVKVEQPLSDDRQANLTAAKAWIQQAEEALKKDELTQARSFAERAQNTAKLLVSGR